MKIALCQINPTVGDLPGNVRLILEAARRARAQGAALAVFPELCVTGYPPLDLLARPDFLHAARRALDRIATGLPADLGAVVGAPVSTAEPAGKPLHNAALLLENGRIVGIARKQLLPAYDVFDETRYFEPAPPGPALDWRGLRIGLNLCEDMWNEEEDARRPYRASPLDALAAAGADLFVNISASPFDAGKHERRNRLVARICRRLGRPFVLVNTVGGGGEVLFDGDSRVHGADGTRLLCAPSFEPALLVWDAAADHPPCPLRHDDEADLEAALVMGLRDFFEKPGRFARALVPLTGEAGAAVTLALAVRALGAERVVAVAPDARAAGAGALAARWGVPLHRLPDASPPPPAAPPFAGGQRREEAERMQAALLDLLAARADALCLCPASKTEVALGGAAGFPGGDRGLGVLADVYLSRVRLLGDRLGAPSAGPERLFPEARGLPELDAVLRLYLEEHRTPEEIAARTGCPVVEAILDRVDAAEPGRRARPPGLRVSRFAFGSGRRLPLVHRWNRGA